jgi:hypothetical protein
LPQIARFYQHGTLFSVLGVVGSFLKGVSFDVFLLSDTAFKVIDSGIS